MNSQILADMNGISEPSNSSLTSPAKWFVDFWNYGRESDSGVKVNWQTTLGVSAAWYCVNLISDAIAQTPLVQYSRGRKDQVEEDRTHPAGRSLRNPSDAVNAFHFRKTLTTHALTCGNGRALIEFNGRQEPAGFIILDPERTKTVAIHNEELGTRQKYHVVFPETGSPIPIPDDEVLHIFKTSFDGMNGLGVTDILRNPIGLGVAGDKDVSYRFKNHGIPSLILEAPPGAFRKKEDAEEFLRDFNDRHSGTSNSGRVGMLRDGIKANTIGAAAVESQLVEMREFQVREIMRVYGVPVIPGVSDSQSYNSLEQLNRALLIHCFGPWMRIWATECAAKLLTRAERRAESYYFEFDTWDLVKPDSAQLGDMISKLRQSMIITGNEGRNWIDLPPHKDGEKLENPMTSSGQQQANQQPNPPEPTPDQAKQRERQLVAAKLAPIIRAEASRITEMAVKARNFINWMDEFYAKQQTRLAETLHEINAPDWIAKEHCETAKLELLDLASGDAASFSQRVSDAMKRWEEKIKQLTEKVVP